jgi:DNA-directed RNA polymerase specialized sigma24 family protein
MNRGHPHTPAAVPWPSPEEAAALFARLVAGDPLAPPVLAEAFLDPLVAHLRIKYPRVDDHAHRAAAADAIISLLKSPAQFDPAQRTLAGYLRMSAEGDLLNFLNREKKHHDRRENWDPVEHDTADRNSGEAGESDLPSFDHPALAAVIRGLSDVERRVFELLVAGERGTEVFAAALGLADVSPDEQEASVKRAKDRIKQRLKRAAEEKP